MENKKAVKLEEMQMEISGEIYTVSRITSGYFGDLLMIETDEGCDFYVSEDEETAGEAAKEYWRDMAENDPKEFICIIGEDTLVGWALGNSAGHAGCSSLEEWLDLTATVPEEQWAGYDGIGRDIDRMHPDLAREFENHGNGIVPTVAYRRN